MLVFVNFACSEVDLKLLSVACYTCVICARNCSICRHRALGWTFFIFLPFLCQRVRWILKTLIQIQIFYHLLPRVSVNDYLKDDLPTAEFLTELIFKTSKEKIKQCGTDE